MIRFTSYFASAAIAVGLAATLAPSPAEARPLGPTNGRVDVSECRPGEYVIGLAGRTGAWVDRIGVICGRVEADLSITPRPRPQRRFGGRGGAPARLLCPRNTVAVGHTGRSGAYLDRVVLFCARLDARRRQVIAVNERRAGAFGGRGGARFGSRPMCRGYEAITGFTVWHAQYVNAVEMRCGRLPRIRGGGGGAAGDNERPVGNQAGGFDQSRCRRGQVVIGVAGRTGAWIDRIGVICGRVRRNGVVVRTRRDGPRFGGGGGGYTESLCPIDTVAVGFRGRSGAHLDQVRLICRQVGRRGGRLEPVGGRERAPIFGGRGGANQGRRLCGEGRVMRGLGVWSARYVNGARIDCGRIRRR